MLWTGLPGPHLHLLVACAILDMERDTLMLSGFGSNEILKVRLTLPSDRAHGTQRLEGDSG